MNKHKKTAVIVGILILAAYSIVGSNDPNARMLGMFLEVMSGLAVIGIAVLMFPLLQPYGTTISRWYLALKTVEGVFSITAGIFFLLHTPVLLEMRDQIYLLHGYIFAVPTLMFYYLLYKSKFIPAWLSIWGVAAAVLLVLANVLEVLKGIPSLEIMYFPIVLNEVVLAIWLIVKGFNMGEGLE